MQYRIFVVEDHPIIRKSYELYLGLEDDLTLCGMAASAEEALDEIPRHAPDVVLVDISLPAMSGLDLVRRLKDDQPDRAVIVVSGHGEDRYGPLTREAGADGFVAKGDVDVLATTIREVLTACDSDCASAATAYASRGGGG